MDRKAHIRFGMLMVAIGGALAWLQHWSKMEMLVCGSVALALWLVLPGAIRIFRAEENLRLLELSLDLAKTRQPIESDMTRQLAAAYRGNGEITAFLEQALAGQAIPDVIASAEKSLPALRLSAARRTRWAWWLGTLPFLAILFRILRFLLHR